MNKLSPFCLTLLSFLFLFLVPQVAKSSGGSENLVLVVNAESPSSLLIANHYIALRNIPERNVIYLENVPKREITTLGTFKKRIMEPLMAKIQDRKLGENIDYIVYSADFPSIISVPDHREKLIKEVEKQGKPMPVASKRVFNPHCSISSATYFMQAFMRDDPSYMALNANFYYRGKTANTLSKPFVGADQKEFEKAIANANGDKLDTAITQLETLAERHPNQMAVLYWLARIHARNGDVAQATVWLRRAVVSGWSYRNYTEADNDFSKALDDPDFSALVARIPDESFKYLPTMGFKSRNYWAPNGSVNGTPDQGQRFFLSTVLAVTRNQGCTEEQALASLKRNAVVDGTSPDGTFYFADTKDVRNRTRLPNYRDAIENLKRLGMRTRVITDKIPIRQNRVMGLTNGTANFDWEVSKSTILPGAICDNLTSWGGRMNRPGQTKCTAFIAAGAAGASGTVIEPYAMQPKFPHPMIHVRYVQGCSLAEAFYQSVHGPFQLLIVGDALCQPFAKIPSFELTGFQPNEMISGVVEGDLDFSKSPSSVKEIELYINGRLINRRPVSDKLRFDSAKIPDGYHELRVVAVANTLIETTGRKLIPIRVNNHGHQVELETDREQYDVKDSIKFKLKTNYGVRMVLTHNYRELKSKKGREAEFVIPASMLGRGPVKLTAVAFDENDTPVSSVPLELTINGPISRVKAQTEPKPKTDKKK